MATKTKEEQVWEVTFECYKGLAQYTIHYPYEQSPIVTNRLLNSYVREGMQILHPDRGDFTKYFWPFYAIAERKDE